MVYSKLDYLVAAMWLNLVGVAVTATVWFGSNSLLRSAVVAGIFYLAVSGFFLHHLLSSSD